jgi:hypothetical protein
MEDDSTAGCEVRKSGFRSLLFLRIFSFLDDISPDYASFDLIYIFILCHVYCHSNIAVDLHVIAVPHALELE